MGATAHNPPNYAIGKLGSVGGESGRNITPLPFSKGSRVNGDTSPATIDPTTITPDAQGNYPPIVHYAALPTNNLVGSVNGMLSGVLAYAGLQLFVEFMAEMKRPRDFLKVDQKIGSRCF